MIEEQAYDPPPDPGPHRAFPAGAICSFCRHREAGLKIDGELACFNCLEDLLDRERAIEIRPELREKLPPLSIAGGMRQVRRPLNPDEEREGREKAVALRLGWAGGGLEAWAAWKAEHPGFMDGAG